MFLVIAMNIALSTKGRYGPYFVTGLATAFFLVSPHAYNQRFVSCER